MTHAIPSGLNITFFLRVSSSEFYQLKKNSAQIGFLLSYRPLTKDIYISSFYFTLGENIDRSNRPMFAYGERDAEKCPKILYPIVFPCTIRRFSLPFQHSRNVLVDQFLVIRPQFLDVGHLVVLRVQIVFAENAISFDRYFSLFFYLYLSTHLNSTIHFNVSISFEVQKCM